MGIYATTTSISELIPNFLSGNTTTFDMAGTAMFSRHIDRSESVVNTYVTSRYSLPFSPVPPILRTISEDIACYFAVRSAYTQDGQNRNQYFPEYREAMKTLESIRKGDIKLGYTDGSLVAVNTSARYISSTENYTPVFGTDDPENWKVDDDLVKDQSNARD